MTAPLPDPDALHPLPEHPRVIHLAPLVQDRANVTVGRFAYYDDPDTRSASSTATSCTTTTSWGTGCRSAPSLRWRAGSPS